jgi:hypothetical protein
VKLIFRCVDPTKQLHCLLVKACHKPCSLRTRSVELVGLLEESRIDLGRGASDFFVTTAADRK